MKGLGVELAEMGDRFTAGYARVREWLATRPRTLVHGDYHADNVLLRTGEVAVLDWGMASIGLGAYDVARLASTSAAALPTRESLERAARAWHDELEARGVADYPWDAAWSDFTVGVALAFPSVFAPLRPEAAPHRAETARRRSLRVGAALRALQIDDPSVPSLTRMSPG